MSGSMPLRRELEECEMRSSVPLRIELGECEFRGSMPLRRELGECEMKRGKKGSKDLMDYADTSTVRWSKEVELRPLGSSRPALPLKRQSSDDIQSCMQHFQCLVNSKLLLPFNLWGGAV